MPQIFFIRAGLAAGFAFSAGAVMAATGTSDAATAADGISGAFNDFLGGSGGAMFAVVSVLLGIAAAVMRPSIQVFGGMMAVGGLIGYGVDVISGFGSVTATIPAKLSVVVDLAMALPPSI